MNIEKNRITLTEKTYAYIYRTSEKEIFETFRDALKQYIYIINELVDQDLGKLSDEEFYNLLCKAYSISLTEEDYLEILSKKNNKKYNRFTEIGTFMTFADTATEGHGSDFSWWEQFYQVRYIVAVSEDIEIKYDSILRKKDIKRLVENKSIVIVGNKTKPLDDKLNTNEKVEVMPSTNLNCFHSFGKMYGSIYKDENFSIIVSMLRERFTKKRVLKDMKDYMEELQKQIGIVLSNLQQGFAYSEVSKICNEWYEKSHEKETVERLQRKLNKGGIVNE